MKLHRASITDTYFMDARSKLIDIAAFMDRVERFEETDDYRYQEFVKALDALELSGDRAETVLKMLSDPSAEPCEKAGKPAVGAYKRD
ncbi:MAG: hypothetical protein ACPGSB_12270 [Opitutales bacterium]